MVQDYVCDVEVSWCNWRLTLFTRWPLVSRSEGIDPWVMFLGKRCPNTFNCIHQEINANLCNRDLSSEGCVIGVYCRTLLDVTRKLILIEDLFARVRQHLFCYVICKFWEPWNWKFKNRSSVNLKKTIKPCIPSSIIFRSHHAVAFYETMNTSTSITMYIYAVLKYHQIGSCRFSQPGNEIKCIFKCTFETCCSIIICSNSGDMVLEVFVMSTNISTCVIWNTILNLKVVSIEFQAMIFFLLF